VETSCWTRHGEDKFGKILQVRQSSLPVWLSSLADSQAVASQSKQDEAGTILGFLSTWTVPAPEVIVHLDQ